MRDLDEIINDLPPERRAKVMARGQRLIQAAREALSFAKGEADPADYVVHAPSKAGSRRHRPVGKGD